MINVCPVCGGWFVFEDYDCPYCAAQCEYDYHEPNYQIVTREMALDAGDLRLEGQLIEW